MLRVPWLLISIQVVMVNTFEGIYINTYMPPKKHECCSTRWVNGFIISRDICSLKKKQSSILFMSSLLLMLVNKCCPIIMCLQDQRKCNESNSAYILLQQDNSYVFGWISFYFIWKLNFSNMFGFHIFSTVNGLKKHWCTLYGHLTMLLPFGRYFQTNCCIMCRRNIFDKHILYMYDSLKKWPLPIKDNIRDNDFELPRISTFIHTTRYSHTVTHICTLIKNLAKDNDMENGTREVCCFI